MPQAPRSVRIGDDERTGWSSERPRRPGEPERGPRPVDVSVRGRVLAPAETLRYAPGSLLLVVSPDAGAAESFCARVIAEPNALLTLGRVRGLLAGRVPDDEIDAKAKTLLDTAAGKRLAEGQTVVIPLGTLDFEVREHYVRLAAAQGRPRHLILIEAPKDQVADEDREPLSALRTALDAGELGAEGFATSLRLGGRTVGELRRIAFARPPRDA